MYKKKEIKNRNKCGTCQYAYGHRSPSLATGELLMCLCPYVDEAKHYILCSTTACYRYRPRE